LRPHGFRLTGGAQPGGNGRKLLAIATAKAADIRKGDRRQATGRAIEEEA